MRKSKCWNLAALAGLAVSASSALGQLVVGNDDTTGQLFVVDLLIPANTRSLGSGTDFQVNGLAADNAANILYWIDGTNRLMRAPMVTSGTLTPIFIGTTNIGGTSVSITGLAWDSTDNMLVAYKNSTTAGPEGFYQVNLITAECTLLFGVALTSDDFGGFDFDPVSNSFFGGNDSTTAANRGLYQIQKPWTSPTFTRLAAYPGTDTDVDGAAVGGGRVYLVNDTASQGAYVWNIAGGAFETTLTLPYTQTGIFSGGAWAPGLLPALLGADVSLSIEDSPDPVVVPPGSNITYTVTIANAGPDAATGVTFTDVLPGNTTFVSVQSPGIFNNGTVTANIGDLAVGAQVSFQIVVSPNGLGTVTNIAGISTGSNDPNTANNSATNSTTVRAPLADISAAITPPGDCSVPVGGTATYLFNLSNTGPEAAEGSSLVVTFPSNVTFLSSLPPVTPAGDTLTLDLGTVNPGGGGSLSVDFRVDSGTSVTMGAAASSTTGDPNSGNNSSGHMLSIPTQVPTTATITGVFSTIATSDTSLVPNLGGARFSSSGGIQRPFASSNGQHFAVVVDTDIATTTMDQVLLVGTPGGSFAVAAQEGVTTTPDGGDLIGAFDEVVGINDSGNYVFSTNTDLTANDEVVIKSTGETLVTVARENQPGPGGFQSGASSDGASIQNDGTVSFYTSLVTGSTATDTAWVTDDLVLLVQEGTNIPTNQANGTTHPVGLLQTGGTEGAGLSLNASGSSYCGIADLTVVPSTESRVLLVDGDVKIQEGYIIPGTSFTSPVKSASPLTNVMTSDGSWLAYGSNADDQDWVVRNGAVIAQTGGPVTPDSGLTWGDASYAQTFFMAAGNGAGDYVVGGVFGGPLLSNAALVLNGTTIIARENDPIDLDNNGAFDDGYYLRTFIDDRLFVTDDAVYCVVRLRDAAAAVCPGTDTDRGQALIRIPLGGGDTCPPCAADFNQDGGVDGADVESFFTAWESGETCGDVNQDGGVDGSDVESFFTVWENGGC